MIKNKPYPYYKIPDILNFREYLNQCENDYKYKTAFSFRKNNNIEKKTYREVNEEVKFLATNFINMNYQKEKIAIISENSYEWILIYFGVVTSQNIIVPIDKGLNVQEIEYILNETKPKILFYSDQYYDCIKELKNDNSIKLVNVNQLKKMINEGRRIYKKNKDVYYNVKINPDDLATIIYTSGTTGVAKGVMLTHRNICMNYVGGRKNLNVWGKSILVLPLHHTYAFTGSVLCVMGCGTEIFINDSLKRIVSDMKEQKPNLMTVVPMMLETFYKQIWINARKNKKDKILKVLMKISNFLIYIGIDIRRKMFKSILEAFGGNLEIIICGGAALETKYVKDFRTFGIQIIQGYGITECSPMLAVTRNYYYKDTSVGLKLYNMDIKIDKFNNSDEGEILVKGDCVMKGYYNNPELTKECFDEDGYFKTGDIGKLDSDGFIYITGRKKNMIILENGKNVYPEELEFELQKNEIIKEVMVYEEEGKIIAEVFPNKEKAEELKIDNIEKYYEKYLDDFNKKQPLYKNISNIKIRNEEFPKTTSMKIRRFYNN